MPTVMRAGGYRLFFYSSDGLEPAHVHIEREDKIAKFWLVPVSLQDGGGFRKVELGRIEALVRQHEHYLKESWDAYFCS